MSIRVLIVDDHHIVRNGLKLLLKTDPEIQVVGEAADGEEAVQLSLELKPDVVLMDLIMPVLDGFEATKAVREKLPQVQVLALTSMLESQSATKAIQAGANGYIPKDSQVEDLIRAIKQVARGQVQVPQKVLASLMQKLQQADSDISQDDSDKLTQREVAVLQMLVQGYPNKAIALNLNVTIGTVKTHVSNILRKLGVKTRSQAVIRAMEVGLVNTPASKSLAIR